jgi:hypothetical protein
LGEYSTKKADTFSLLWSYVEVWTPPRAAADGMDVEEVVKGEKALASVDIEPDVNDVAVGLAR